MHHPSIEKGINVVVIAFGLYALTKFAVLALVAYDTRRKALDKAYAGRAYATGRSDLVLLIVTLVLSVALLWWGAEPLVFLGGLMAGATLIQLYFHAFHASVPAGREAPEPRSPLKIMSYAIQAEPLRAWKEMLALAALVVAALTLHYRG